MTATEVIATLAPLVPNASFEAAPSVDFATIYVPADRLVETCRTLRDAEAFRFTTIIEITAADYIPRQPRFEVVYHLLSIPRRARLRLKVRVPDRARCRPCRASGKARAGPSAKCGTCSASSSTVIPICAGC